MTIPHLYPNPLSAQNGHDGGRGGGNGVHAAKAAEPSYGDSMAMLSKDLGVVVTVSPVAVSPVG